MIKYILAICIILKSFIGDGQTSFVKKTGDIVGNQTVVMVDIAPAGYPQAQALLYLPDDYNLPKNATKTYPLAIFSNGVGEGKGWDISILCNQSLPKFLKAGYKPYGFDKNGDTVKFIVVSPFAANTGYTYTFPQLQYTLPYILSKYRIDTSCIVFTGLSAGAGAATSMIMGNGGAPSYKDSLITRKVKVIMPMAGYGYDQNFDVKIMKALLDTNLRRGVFVHAIIGDMDQGYNDLGFKRYAKEDSLFGIQGHYFHKVMPGLSHEAKVWEAPFAAISPFDANGKMNIWTQVWQETRTATTQPPPVVTPPPVTPKPTPYILKICVLMSDSTTVNLYTHP